MPIVTDQNKYVEAPGILGMYSAMPGFTDDINRPTQYGGFLPWADIIKAVAPVIGVKLAETIVPAVAGKVVDLVLPKPAKTSELVVPASLKPKKKKQKMLPPPDEVVAKLPPNIAAELADEMDSASSGDPYEMELSKRFAGFGLNKKSKQIASAKTKNIMKSIKRGRGINML